MASVAFLFGGTRDQNWHREMGYYYAIPKEDRDTSEELHNLRIENIKREMEERLRAGKSVYEYEIELLKEESRYREVINEEIEKKREKSIKSLINYSKNEYDFLVESGSESVDTVAEKIDYLKSEIDKVKKFSGVSDIMNVSFKEYSALSSLEKSALSSARDMLIEIKDLNNEVESRGQSSSLSENIHEIRTVTVPKVYNFNIALSNDFSNAFITESPKDFYSNRFENLVKETIKNEALSYGS